VHVDQHGADFRQLHLEAGPVGFLEQLLELLAGDFGAGEGDAEHVRLALELHVRGVQEAQAFDRHAFAFQQHFPSLNLPVNDR